MRVFVSSMRQGVPCIATPEASEGMGLEDGRHTLIAADPRTMADAVAKLYTSREFWSHPSEGGLKLMRESFSTEAVRGRDRATIKAGPL